MKTEPHLSKVPFNLGRLNFEVVTWQHGPAQPTFVNLHEDETTSIEAGRINIQAGGGRLIKIAHSGARLITFELAGQTFSFDPNRMFSDCGIRATLEKHACYSTAAHAAIKNFADAYLRQFALEQEPVIIALHNTVDGLFSALSFSDKGNLASDAAAVHINPHRRPFDFFYVTHPDFFERFKALGFNVVLQNDKTVTDDGSLSVHLARKKVPYINVEAELGRLEEQVEMLQAVRAVIGI